MPNVSVIVPVYGVERYIERCARSLFEQTLDDLEFIFVDDCTKDNSIRVLERVIEDYPNRKEQIKILHHEHNKGLSHARETGVNTATGEYIAHCDSDDWVEIEMYAEMYKKAKESDSDFIKCGYCSSDGASKSFVVNVYFEQQNIDRDNIIRYLLLRKGWNSIWNTLVKRELYENVLYTDNAMLEDFYVTTQLILKSEKFAVVNKPFYNYYSNPNSICGVTDPNAVISRSVQAAENITDILTFIRMQYGERYKREELSLMFVPRLILIPIMHHYKYYPTWWKTKPSCTLRFLMSKDISLVYKLWYLQVELLLRPLMKS